MKRIFHTTWTIPLAFLVLCAVSYGLLARWLGFYWDDWAMAWHAHAYGPSGFIDYWAMDRPFLPWIYMLTSWLLGESPLYWHLFNVLAHWICALAAWWFLRTLWRDKIILATWIVALFAVYPGFKQSFIAYTYCQYFIIQAILFVSLTVMILAVRNPRHFWPLTVFSFLLSAVNLFSMEYFFSLDLMRPAVIWIVLSEAGGKIWPRARKTVLIWLPYLILFAFYLVWRVFIFKFPTFQPILLNDLRSDPLATFLGLARIIGFDLVQSTLLAWGQVFTIPNLAEFGALSTYLYAGLALVCVVVTIWCLLKLNSTQRDEKNDKGWFIQPVLLGLYTLLIGGWPYWIPGLALDLTFPWDRFFLPMMIGASIFIVGILALIPRFQIPKTILIGVLVGLAIAFQYQVATTFRRDWNAQKNFIWQLTWRIPALEPGTLILSNDLAFAYDSDHSLTGPLNWTYAPDNHSRQIPYMMNYVSVRLDSILPGLEEGLPVHQVYRAATFDSSTSQALLLVYEPPACLHVLDPARDDLLPLPTEDLSKAVGISHLDQIIPSPAQPARPPAMIGAEPGPSWCYYYEKAELARQMGDWEQIASLGEKAFDLDETPNDASEYLPFIEGYARAGQWEKADQLSQDMLQKSSYRLPILCKTWKSLKESPDSDRQFIDQQIRELKCP